MPSVFLSFGKKNRSKTIAIPTVTIFSGENGIHKNAKIVDIFRARIVDVAPNSIVIEMTGDEPKVNGLLAMLDGFNIIEIVRTGLAGISRGLDSVNKKDDN